MKATFFLLLALVACLVQAESFSAEKFLSFKNGLKATPSTRKVQDTTCAKITCASKGQSCFPTITGTTITSVPVCTDETTFCNAQSATTATCTEKLNNNANCTSDNDCKSDNCSFDDICVPQPTPTTIVAENGRPCSSNAGCISNICTSSVCVGIANNVACRDDAQCASQNCNDNDVCAAQAGNNAACSLTESSPCVMGHNCAPRKSGTTFAGVCIQEFTGASGSFCRSNIDCAEGNACFRPTTEIYGTCGKAAGSTKKGCDDDTTNVCGDAETCECNSNTGNNICISRYINNPKGAKDIAADIAKCFTGSCKDQPNDECYLAKCKKETCKYARTQFNILLNDAAETTPKCALNSFSQYTDDICSASILSTASVVAVAFLGVAALLFTILCLL